MLLYGKTLWDLVKASFYVNLCKCCLSSLRTICKSNLTLNVLLFCKQFNLFPVRSQTNKQSGVNKTLLFHPTFSFCSSLFSCCFRKQEEISRAWKVTLIKCSHSLFFIGMRWRLTLGCAPKRAISNLSDNQRLSWHITQHPRSVHPPHWTHLTVRCSSLACPLIMWQTQNLSTTTY